MLLVDGQHLAEFDEKVLAHGAISHLAVAVDAVTQLINGLFLVHLFIFCGFAPTPAHESMAMRGEGGGLGRLNTVAPLSVWGKCCRLSCFSFYLFRRFPRILGFRDGVCGVCLASFSAVFAISYVAKVGCFRPLSKKMWQNTSFLYIFLRCCFDKMSKFAFNPSANCWKG